MSTLKLIGTLCVLITLYAAPAASQVVEPGARPDGGSVKQSSTPTRDERYRIGYQDTLEVSVSKHAELSGNFNVSSDGTIVLPRIADPVVAVCKTERELANELENKYKYYLRDPFVNVRAVDSHSQSVAVIGAVEKPGNFFLNRRVRLLELLSFAGGPDIEKAGMNLIVARTGSSSGCREKSDSAYAAVDPDLVFYQFRIKDVLGGKENLWMQPGDIVSVLDADLIYVYGNVNKQGPVKLKQQLTLRQALASAEGMKSASKQDKIRVLRQKGEKGDWEELVFDLRDIDKGKVQDPILLPNDIVAVSEDKVKSILNSVGKGLTGGAGGLFYRLP
jgi:polysaccharide biosynthesis/export protein